jgi:hypothetical protein
MMLGAEKPRETHFLSNEENLKLIEDYVDRETAVVRKRDEDTEGAVQQEQNDMTLDEITGLSSREAETTFEGMLVAIGGSLRNLACSDHGEDGEDEDNEETEQGRFSEDDEPGRVMGTIRKTVQQRMERFRQKQMKLNKPTQPGWQDTAEYFWEWDMKYSTCDLRVPAVVQPQTDDDTPTPPPTTIEDLMDSLEIVSGTSQWPQGTS